MTRHISARCGIATLAIAITTLSATGEIVTFDLNDIASWADQGDDGNWVLSNVVQPDQQIVGFGYELELETFGPSWLSEAAIGISDAAALDDGFILSPGAGFNLPGAETFSTGGIIPLSLIGSAPVPISSNTLRIEFFETFTDFPNQADAVWNGTLSLDLRPVPGAGTMALFGCIGALTRRRRRQ